VGAFGNKFVYDGVPGTHLWYDGTPHPWEVQASLASRTIEDRPERLCRGRRHPPCCSPDGARRGRSSPDCARTHRPSSGAGRWWALPCTRSCSIRPTLNGSSSPSRRRARSDRRCGTTWRPINRGLRSGRHSEPDCRGRPLRSSHRMHPSRPSVLFMQKHWDSHAPRGRRRVVARGERNLPTDFGFAIDVHAHEPATIYVVPIKSDSEHYRLTASCVVYRSRTGGDEGRRSRKGCRSATVRQRAARRDGRRLARSVRRVFRHHAVRCTRRRCGRHLGPYCARSAGCVISRRCRHCHDQSRASGASAGLSPVSTTR